MLMDSPWAFGSSPGQDRGSDPAGVRASLALPGYAIVAAEDAAGGRLVAAAGVRREDAAKRRHLATVWGVFVSPQWRGRGVARAVVGGVLEVARGWEGVEALQLSVSERGTAARRLYESLGFVAWGTEPDALRVDGEPYAETHMWRRP